MQLTTATRRWKTFLFLFLGSLYLPVALLCFSLRPLCFTHLCTCTYAATQWQEISSCPINRCCRTKMEHVSSGAVRRWQGIHHNARLPCFPGLRPPQVLWLITPATEQQGKRCRGLVLTRTTFNKSLLSQKKHESFVFPLENAPASWH